MPITANDYLKNLRLVVGKIPSETSRIVYENKQTIIISNIEEIQKGKGSDGQDLINSNPLFSGFYTKYTQSLYPEKTAGTLYTFFQTGNFLNGFYVDVLPNKQIIEINSTGTGSGKKADFFTGYPHLFGLNKEDQKTLNWDVIYPELMAFIKQYV